MIFGAKVVSGDYRSEVLRFVLEQGKKGVTASEVYKWIRRVFGEESVSRTAIIFYLNELCERGLLTYVEETGRGGRHKKYIPVVDKMDYYRQVAEDVIRKMCRENPEATIQGFLEALRKEQTLLNTKLLDCLLKEILKIKSSMEQNLS